MLKSLVVAGLINGGSYVGTDLTITPSARMVNVTIFGSILRMPSSDGASIAYSHLEDVCFVVPRRSGSLPVLDRSLVVSPYWFVLNARDCFKPRRR